MSAWEPVDVDPIDHDEIADEDGRWDNNLMKDIEKRFEELRQFIKKFNESHDKATREDT